MKKIFKGCLQIFTFFLVHEIGGILINLFHNFDSMLVNQFPFLDIMIFEVFRETWLYTLLPMLLAMVILFAINQISKKTTLGIFPFAICTLGIICLYVWHIITCIDIYGLVSWETGNTVWSSIIICGLTITGLQAIYRGEDLNKDNSKKETTSNVETMQTEKSVSTKKVRYCSRCGSAIDTLTKKCTGCGKQYFRPKKFIKGVIFVSGYVFFAIAWFLANRFADEYNKLYDEIQTIRQETIIAEESPGNISDSADVEALQQKIKMLENEIIDLKEKNQTLIDIYNNKDLK